MPKKTPLGQLFPIWLSVQTELPKVKRWSKHRKKNHKLRIQTVDKHVLSIGLIAKIMLIKMHQYYPYDQALISLAFDLHDLPEGFLNRDITWREKKKHHDLDEYLVFVERFKHLEPVLFHRLHYAFLLQFAIKNPPDFPEEAQEVMSAIRRKNKNEALLFGGLEAWEYNFYAYEGFLHHNDYFLLYDIVISQMEIMQNLAKELPGYREEIFTVEFEAWCQSVIDKEGHV